MYYESIDHFGEDTLNPAGKLETHTEYTPESSFHPPVLRKLGYLAFIFLQLLVESY